MCHPGQWSDLVTLPAVLQSLSHLALRVLLLVFWLGHGVCVQAPLVVVASPVHLIFQPVELLTYPGVLILVLFAVRLLLLSTQNSRLLVPKGQKRGELVLRLFITIVCNITHTKYCSTKYTVKSFSKDPPIYQKIHQKSRLLQEHMNILSLISNTFRSGYLNQTEAFDTVFLIAGTDVNEWSVREQCMAIERETSLKEWSGAVMYGMGHKIGQVKMGVILITA